MKPCLSTLFDQYDVLWGVFTVKRHNFTQRFDLQGHARVQIFTYKDVSVCISLTWSPRMHANVQLKTRSHTCVHVCLTKTYLYPFLSYETHVCITYFPITLTEKNVYTQLLTYKAAFLKNSLSWPTCLHASSSTKRSGNQPEHSILSRDLSPASLKTYPYPYPHRYPLMWRSWTRVSKGAFRHIFFNSEHVS